VAPQVESDEYTPVKSLSAAFGGLDARGEWVLKVGGNCCRHSEPARAPPSPQQQLLMTLPFPGVLAPSFVFSGPGALCVSG
jgi:hypothetical protein